MKRKYYYLILAIVLLGGLGGLVLHKQSLDKNYQGFAVVHRVIHSNRMTIPISKNATIKSVKQHVDKTDYYVTLKIDAKSSENLVTDHWYLNEGIKQQPNQFINTEINGRDTNQLEQGMNVVKLKTNIDPNQKHHNLSIIINRAKGKYQRIDFR
jgi:predicted transposase YbfD/YdcC